MCDQLNEEPLDLKVKLLCGADLLESFAVPGLWKDSDVSEIQKHVYCKLAISSFFRLRIL